MNVKELRIGNYVTDEFGNTGMISSIDSDLNMHGVYRVFCVNQNGTYEYHHENIRGIKLTEELLLKCGFKIQSDSFMGVVMGKKVINQPLEHWVGLKNNGDYFILSNPHTNTHIIHLHQLQNLYFDLTGEELEVVL